MNFRIKVVYVLICCVLLLACEVGEKIDEYNMGNDVFFYVLKKDNKIYLATVEDNRYYDVEQILLVEKIWEKSSIYETAKILEFKEYGNKYYRSVIECLVYDKNATDRKYSTHILEVFIERKTYDIKINFDIYNWIQFF